MKGKQAAQAANRRLIEAQARIAELESGRVADAKAAREREHELTNELNQVRGDLVRRVKDVSAERVQEAFDKGAADLAAARADFEDRIQRVTYYVSKKAELRISIRGIIELSKILGVQPGQLIQWGGLESNTHSRKLTRSTANLIADNSESSGVNAALQAGLYKARAER